MTFRNWLEELDKCLGSLPLAERQRAAEFYKELYSDEKEAGMSELEILSVFGSPAHAAAEILNNAAGEYAHANADEGLFRGTTPEGQNRTYGQYGNGMPEKNSFEAKNATEKKDGILYTHKSKLVAGLCAAGLAFLLSSCAIGIVGSILASEIALLITGIILLSGGTATLAAGLIALGVFILLAMPIYYGIKYTVKGIIWVTRKFYTSLLTEGIA